MRSCIYFFSSLLICLLMIIKPAKAQNNALLQAADSLFAGNDWKGAKEKYASYLADTLAAKNAVAWNKLGYCNYNLGFYQDAITDFNKTLANKPKPPVRNMAMSRMSRVYAAINKIDESAEWLTKATMAGYNSLPDLDSLADYKNVRESQKYAGIRKQLYEILYPCSREPHNHDFDFWVGDWDTYPTGSKFLTGRSHVEVMAGGCAILENFTSVQAYTGKSFNYYDPAKGKWEQDWVGSGGAGDRTRYYNGEYRDGAMHFTSETTDAKGNKTLGNFIFYNIDKNTVRQYLELSTDGGKTYQVSYDLTYIRRK
ncbi:MAG: tetratricopeptide repeat protein [Mucilaginibacter sp.]